MERFIKYIFDETTNFFSNIVEVHVLRFEKIIGVCIFIVNYDSFDPILANARKQTLTSISGGSISGTRRLIKISNREKFQENIQCFIVLKLENSVKTKTNTIWFFTHRLLVVNSFDIPNRTNMIKLNRSCVNRVPTYIYAKVFALKLMS